MTRGGRTRRHRRASWKSGGQGERMIRLRPCVNVVRASQLVFSVSLFSGSSDPRKRSDCFNVKWPTCRALSTRRKRGMSSWDQTPMEKEIADMIGLFIPAMQLKCRNSRIRKGPLRTDGSHRNDGSESMWASGLEHPNGCWDKCSPYG